VHICDAELSEYYIAIYASLLRIVNESFHSSSFTILQRIPALSVTVLVFLSGFFTVTVIFLSRSMYELGNTLTLFIVEFMRFIFERLGLT
jgi:hypothetical protein